MLSNPYEQLYRAANPSINEVVPIGRAEQMTSHLAQMYNAFGVCLKDLTKLLSLLYQDQDNKVKSKEQKDLNVEFENTQKKNEDCKKNNSKLSKQLAMKEKKLFSKPSKIVQIL